MIRLNENISEYLGELIRKYIPACFSAVSRLNAQEGKSHESFRLGMDVSAILANAIAKKFNLEEEYNRNAELLFKSPIEGITLAEIDALGYLIGYSNSTEEITAVFNNILNMTSKEEFYQLASTVIILKVLSR
jgi:hypothetical protein